MTRMKEISKTLDKEILELGVRVEELRKQKKPKKMDELINRAKEELNKTNTS